MLAIKCVSSSVVKFVVKFKKTHNNSEMIISSLYKYEFVLAWMCCFCFVRVSCVCVRSSEYIF